MDSTPATTRSRIFDGLSDAERLEWLESGSLRSLRRGEVLARQGEPAHALYLVETGLLKLVQATESGHEVIVRFVGPGEPFGGVVAVDGGVFPVTALAVEPMRVPSWPRAALAPLLQRFPQVRANIMREIADHMNDALARVGELTTERVGQRLARTLLRLMQQCGRKHGDGVLIAHTLTRQELAQLTGTTLYTVSRTLSEWKANGVLGSVGRRLLVRQPEALASLAHSSPE